MGEPEAPGAGLLLMNKASHPQLIPSTFCPQTLPSDSTPVNSVAPWTPGQMSRAELLHSQWKERTMTLQLSAPSLTQQDAWERRGGLGRRFPVLSGLSCLLQLVITAAAAAI